MNELKEIILQQINMSGPISLADYMGLCLTHPEHGYYVTRDPLGAAGDFTTAPEISQMFGELLGIALAQAWADQGQPQDAVLVELGPGRGTLMADIKRTWAKLGLPELPVHLVEASPALQAVQAKALKGSDVNWHDGVETLIDAPLFGVANEFFDALPIQQFEKTGDTWMERRVGIQNDRLCFGLSPSPLPKEELTRLRECPSGIVAEICSAARRIIDQLTSKIAASGGAFIAIDYGGEGGIGDTFQAVKSHEYCDPFEEPGFADLTAHVDFDALGKYAASAHSKMTTQGELLMALGIEARAAKLADNLAGEARDNHLAAFRRLTHPDEMGELFKAMAFFPKGAVPPPGFEP